MAMRRSLRYELTRYRKGKRHSLGATVSGIPYASYSRPTTPSLEAGRHTAGVGYQRDLYMQGRPKDYRPNIHSPNVDWTEYDSHESSHAGFTHTPPIRTGSSDALNMHRLNIPEHLIIPMDELALTEQKLMADGISPRPQENPIEMDASEFAFINGEVRTNLKLEENLNLRPLPALSEITDALSQFKEVLPKDHPDIINLTNAADKLTGGQFSAQNQDLTETEPLLAEESYITDPVLEAEQFFEKQMQLLDRSFETVENCNPEVIVLEDIPFEQSEELVMALDDGLPEPVTIQQDVTAYDSIDDIVESEASVLEQQPQFMAEDIMMPMADNAGHEIAEPFGQDVGTAIVDVLDEINQAIDGVQQQLEPDPMQMQYGPVLRKN